MQTLGVSDSTPKTESRLQSLLWPSVNTAADVDYLGTQGYWVCLIVAIVTCLFLLMLREPLMGLLFFMFYYFGGVGVRERSRYAALVVAIMYSVDLLITLGTIGIGIWMMVRMILAALLLSNVRAAWVSSSWTPGSEEAALPLRLNETLRDRLVDQLPMWLWPRIEILYYIYSVGFMAMLAVIWWMYFTR